MTASGQTAVPDIPEQMRDLLGRAHDRIAAYQAVQSEKIAVIGMAARLPGAADLDAFWDLLATGRDGLQSVDATDLQAAGVTPDRLSDPDYVPVWGGPPEADGFDAEFFGYAPREAELLDPQQRMFLDCAWHALEDAGYCGSGAARTRRLCRGVAVELSVARGRTGR